MPGTAYEEQVFINCPFDSGFQPVFDAIVFAVHDCGFVARCALEADDGSQVRIDKIFRIIDQCRLGIHDISRTESDPTYGLPRFNMPLELGMFLGAKRYGSKRQKNKLCLILDREQFRYQKYCSDIAGQDIRAHADNPQAAIELVRNWLRNATPDPAVILPGGAKMAERYTQFCEELPLMCRRLSLDPDKLIFFDYINLVTAWLKENSR